MNTFSKEFLAPQNWAEGTTAPARRVSTLIKTCVASAMLVAISASVSAQAILGSSDRFAVLGASTVTNTGPTIITGNLGLSPGTAVTGFPPGIVNGAVHIADGVALQAQADANTAYNTLAGMACNTELTGQDLGGLTLTPGVYCFDTSAQLTGQLTLDSQFNDDALFVFQIGSTITTASASSVIMINGGRQCNVFWQVGSSATLGTGTVFLGNILALASITLTTNTDLGGRAFALTAAVTMDTNRVTLPNCYCTIHAAVTDLGPGCEATTNNATLLSSAPVIGQPFNVNIASTMPTSFVRMYISNVGAPVTQIAGSGCLVYLDPQSLKLILLGSTDSEGNWGFNYVVPPHALSLI